MTDATRYLPIEDHGIIGDLHTVALVGINGTIDFMCFPRFDSPSVFASLLDADRGGSFSVEAVNETPKYKQIYLPDSNILLTRFLCADGVAEISDFMPVEQVSQAHNLVRRIKVVRGEFRFRVVCDPHFNYGRSRHRTEHQNHTVVFTAEGPNHLALRLRSSVEMKILNGAAVAEFTLSTGQSVPFVLEDVIAGRESAFCGPRCVNDSFKATLNFWRSWLSHSTYKGRWRETVNRSALAMKLLVYAPAGSLVASPTFGLPEHIGGERNWDYRYTWIRDASFTLYAFMRLGFTEEAGAFMKWFEQRCSELEPDGSLQIMYGIDGAHELPEEILHNFEGYKHSTPVRIGNEAYKQLQLDIYGELMDSIYLYDKYAEMISYELWQNVVRLMDWVCKNWQCTDEGIWEVRGGKHEFLFSRFMCWVALDRAIRLALKRSFPAPMPRWRGVRNRIYADIHTNFWDPKQKSFIQYKGSDSVDASTLLMPLAKFISPVDPRWVSTLKTIEKRLVEDSLVHRYCIGEAAPDGVPGKEGTFSMCSFWFVECLSRMGDLQKARFYFEKMLGYANHLQLFSEQIGTQGQGLGNFPQALTHLALISAAYDLDRRLSAARPEK